MEVVRAARYLKVEDALIVVHYKKFDCFEPNKKYLKWKDISFDDAAFVNNWIYIREVLPEVSVWINPQGIISQTKCLEIPFFLEN